MELSLDAAHELPWLAQPLAQTLSTHRGHALLVEGRWGLGSFEFAMAIAQAWLCEQRETPNARACGACPSCQLVRSKSHPDLRVNMPENLALLHGFPLDLDERKKPSRQIRVDDIRYAIDWVSNTSARGRGKVWVIHPADAMNAVAASALLKTLEEPPGGTRIALTASDSSRLLPTVVSRCQRMALARVDADLANAWMLGQGVDQPEALLRGANGAPLEALAMHREGMTSALWCGLPEDVQCGRADRFQGWQPARVVDVLMKVCHDVCVKIAGGQPCFFPAGRVPATGTLKSMESWRKSLVRVSMNAEHPWHEPLLIEALIAEGQSAMRE